ncbi:DNA replication/repair protein RecF [Caloranaerobacter azorensis]|uniref:DNA replication and repair protein RecF n=1 Tax=Caloranaerobacter azorensis TaxID=116090 RepID=A0A6P1YFJ1_9FIRM|nr:DNA replication/repair protein RecF [Caloranaerobacter azorensis]QIB27857.1 DNA replication/repair protein RecF [Caloranaerobacter azorensis]
MHIENIKLINYRNYDKLQIKLNKKLNIFIGNNAQGKTNLLESLYICAFGKSYRTAKEKELIKIDKDKAYIGINVRWDFIDKFIEIKFEKKRPKRIRINKIEIDRMSDLFGNLNVVLFSPEDLKLVKEGPSNRREFLDTEISQIKPKYRYNINRYSKILKQRNNLLKSVQINNNKLKTIEVWDMQLADVGSEIIKERIEFIEKISKISKKIHKNITDGIEELELKYMPSFNIDCELSKKEIKETFIKVLNKNLSKDIEKGTTEFGPHRDDIKININGLDVKTFGSQGQQRTAALSMKLAEVELVKSEIGEYPVLLLDDVLSELDLKRRKFLLSAFKDIQTIITSTEDIDVLNISKEDKKVFYVSKGNIVNV